MATHPNTYLTPEKYLAIERKAETKSEYYDGVMVTMTGARRKHNLIVTNLIAELRQQLKAKPCEVYPSDMRVRIPKTNSYTYPDVVVVCGEPELEDNHFDTLLNPTVVIEVLSDSTEAFDRGKKFGHYRTIGSLREYLLVAQDEFRIEQYVRQADDRWLLTEATGAQSILRLQSIPGELALNEVYDKVSLD